MSLIRFDVDVFTFLWSMSIVCRRFFRCRFDVDFDVSKSTFSVRFDSINRNRIEYFDIDSSLVHRVLCIYGVATSLLLKVYRVGKIENDMQTSQKLECITSFSSRLL
jgi:hypothetical protein